MCRKELKTRPQERAQCRAASPLSAFLGGCVLVVLGVAASVGCARSQGGWQAQQPKASASVSVAAGTATTTPTASRLPTAVPRPTATPTPSVPLAARVNGFPILLTDFEQSVVEYERALLGQGLDASTQEGQAELAQMKRDLLESMIDTLLLEQAAPHLGVQVTEGDVEAQVESDTAAGGGVAAFDEWLELTGETRSGYARAVRRSLLTRRLQDVVAANTPTVTEQVHARQIVVESFEDARDVLAQLRDGADFAELARERSLDLATKDTGGDLGWLPQGLVAPELEAVVFALQPGQLGDVVALDGRFHVVQVTERDGARPVAIEVQAELKQVAFRRWLDRERAAATIERFVGQ